MNKLIQKYQHGNSNQSNTSNLFDSMTIQEKLEYIKNNPNASRLPEVSFYEKYITPTISGIQNFFTNKNNINLKQNPTLKNKIEILKEDDDKIAEIGTPFQKELYNKYKEYEWNWNGLKKENEYGKKSCQGLGCYEMILDYEADKDPLLNRKKLQASGAMVEPSNFEGIVGGLAAQDKAVILKKRKEYDPVLLDKIEKQLAMNKRVIFQKTKDTRSGHAGYITGVEKLNNGDKVLLITDSSPTRNVGKTGLYYNPNIKEELSDIKDMTIGIMKNQLGGNTQQPILAEQGEVIEDNEGNIQQISTKAPSHDSTKQVTNYGIKKVEKGSGGVIVNAERVLSDSYRQVQSGKRENNEKEEVVKITSSEGESIAMQLGLDIKLKTSLSPSQLFLKIQQERDKQALKLLKSQDVATDSIQNKNAIEANLAQLERLPTDQEVYDIVFNHQEQSKEESGLNFEEMVSSQFGFQKPIIKKDNTLVQPRFNSFNKTDADIRFEPNTVVGRQIPDMIHKLNPNAKVNTRINKKQLGGNNLINKWL